jgi:hypothetical protein
MIFEAVFLKAPFHEVSVDKIWDSKREQLASYRMSGLDNKAGCEIFSWTSAMGLSPVAMLLVALSEDCMAVDPASRPSIDRIVRSLEMCAKIQGGDSTAMDAFFATTPAAPAACPAAPAALPAAAPVAVPAATLATAMGLDPVLFPFLGPLATGLTTNGDPFPAAPTYLF